jgi:hypothetical protein
VNPEEGLGYEAARRHDTDYRHRWGSYFGWNLLTLGFVFTFGGGYSHFATYRLIERRRAHAARRLAFSAYLWHSLAGRADAAGRRPEVQDGLDNLSRIHAQIEEYERRNKRNPALWTALRAAARLVWFAGVVLITSALPDRPGGIVTNRALLDAGAALGTAGFFGSVAVGAFVNAFLHADLRFLETWETSLAENAGWVSARLGGSTVPARALSVPKRSTLLYMFLTAITVGLFSIFWRYTLMDDGNRHFDEDDRMEDAILGGLGLARTRTPAIPPAPPAG